jgi:uncharacterized surface protein with fasciclin (FAS1) repeats
MEIKMKLANLVGIVFMSALVGCGGGGGTHYVPDPHPQPPEPDPTTIVDVAVADGRFTTLVAALQATGLDATLDDANSEFTVFAPTDDAFALLGQETIDILLEDTERLSDILTYHVISGEVDASQAVGLAGSTVAMVNGDSTGLSLDGDDLLINTSTVIITDVEADNGVIHVIDAVLIPPVVKGEPSMDIVETAVANGNFSTLVSVLQATGLDTALSDDSKNYTVFAPTDAAFAMIDPATIEILLANPDVLSNILLQHVVDGEVNSVLAYTLNGSAAATLSGAAIPVGINSEIDKLTFGGATVIGTDVYTSNGVIHVIDTVIVADVEIPDPLGSIVDVAVANGNFTTLVAALQATGLATVLDNSDETFTVFAPTDAAFDLLGQDTIAALLADTDTLTDILLNHVIQGAEVLQDAALTIARSDSNKVTMANSKTAALSLSDNTLFVNKSAVSLADVMGDNGVIHVVDQVILVPASKIDTTNTVVDIATSSDDFSTLVAALTAADLVATLSDESATFTVFAPTNRAFSKIDSEVLNNLLGDKEALTSVLLKHVVSGSAIDSVTAFSANGANISSIGGDSLSVRLVNFAATSNSATDEVAYSKEAQMLVGGSNSSKDGFTVYVLDEDLGSSGSTCVGSCEAIWPPVLVTDGDVANIPGLNLVTRYDGSHQVAYKGRPLYFYANDGAPGDAFGTAVANKWWPVSQEQVALQIQGSNVMTFDIYASNGVVHVIDTVITEAETR